MSKSLTIIIPTKNRSKYIDNCVQYYTSNKFEGTLMILDSSSSKERFKIMEYLKKNNNKIKIKYYYKKNKPTQIIKNFINKIKTQYCIISADDDFLILKTLNFFINFANRNKNIKIINGNVLRLDILNKNRILVNKYYITTNLNVADPYKRITNYLNDYGPINTSLIQTKLLKKIFNLSPSEIELKKKCPVRSINDEMLVGSLMVISSKIYHSKRLFLVRTIHGNNSNLPINYSELDLIKSINYFILSIEKFCKINNISKFSKKNISAIKKDIYRYLKPNSSYININLKYFYVSLRRKLVRFQILRKIINMLKKNERNIENYIENKEKDYLFLKNINKFLIKEK